MKKKQVIITEKDIENAKIEFGLDKTYNNSTHIIAGIDPSLQKTGVIIMDSKGQVLGEELIKTKLMGIERLVFIKNSILTLLKKHNVTIVAIESYSFGSRGRATFSLGELGGVLRVALMENKYNYFDVSPSSLKSFIAENGSADKVMMREAVKKKYKLDISEDNICDAYSLSRMCLALGDSMPRFCAAGGSDLLKKLRTKFQITIQ